METELSFVKKTFLLWVPPFLSYELWKLRIELRNLPIQIALEYAQKRKKKAQHFFYSSFLFPCPTFILFFHFFFFFYCCKPEASCLSTYHSYNPISKFQHIIASYAISLQPHITSSSFKLILSSLFTFYFISSPLVTECIIPSPSNKW